MGNIFIYIMPIMIIGSLVYYFFVVPKIAHNAKVELLKVKDSFAGKEEEITLKYLSNENGFNAISKVLVNEKIIGITACIKRKTDKQVATQLAVNTLKNLIESIIRKFMIRVFGYHGGYEFSREDKGLFYLAITNKALHYLFFDNKKLIEHQQFYFNEMQSFVHGTASKIDDILKGGAHRYPKISFKTATEQPTFFYLEDIECYPSGEPLEKLAVQEVNHLFIIPFKNKITQSLST